MDSFDIRALNEQIERQSAFVTNLQTGMAQVIVGQKHLVESLLIGLLSDGHVLLEGVPGLAKTQAIKTLAIDIVLCVILFVAVYIFLPQFSAGPSVVQFILVWKNLIFGTLCLGVIAFSFYQTGMIKV